MLGPMICLGSVWVAVSKERMTRGYRITLQEAAAQILAQTWLGEGC